MNENLYLNWTNTKYQLVNELRPYKHPRLGKYVLHKVQEHSRQPHCLIFKLKESKLAAFVIAVSSISI